jgi:hypothetical protein
MLLGDELRAAIKEAYEQSVNERGKRFHHKSVRAMLD